MTRPTAWLSLISLVAMTAFYVSLMPPAFADAPAYVTVDLGTLSGDAESIGADINASGLVAGVSAATGVGGCDYYLHHCDYRAFRSDGDTMVDLGFLPNGSSSYGIGINNAGQVVGFGETPDSLEQAFIYNGGSMTSLGILPGGSRSIAYGINDSAQVVGWADIAGDARRAFLHAGGAMIDLGTLPGDDQAEANAINNSGQVVGWSYPASSPVGDCRIYRSDCPYHAFSYSNGAMAPLGTLAGGSMSRALNVNDIGQIVGLADTAAASVHAFLYSGGQMTDLGALGGPSSSSVATDINASGQIVGHSTAASGDWHAFLYAAGSMIDLNDLLPPDSGWSLTYAFGINDAGQITGLGVHQGQQHAFLMTPVGTQLTSLAPARLWIGLKNSDDVGVKFDLRAEVYRNNTLLASGQLNSVPAGSSGFNNAKLNSIPFGTFASVPFPPGTTLTLKAYVRNACVGSTHNSGTARLWYNDPAANSHFGATLNTSSTDYYLRDSYQLATTAGTGPKETINVQSGARCSPFKPFGAWSINP